MPGPDRSTLPSTCPAPRKSRPRPRTLKPRRPRAPPSLPCTALLCWAARAWTSRTSRQSPGTRPEPMAGATGGRGRSRSLGRAEAGRAPASRRGEGRGRPAGAGPGSVGGGRGQRRPRREAPNAAGFSRRDARESEAEEGATGLGAPGAADGGEPPLSPRPAPLAAAAGLLRTIPPNSQLRRERAAAESALSPGEGPGKGEEKRSARNTPFLPLFLPLSLFLRLSGSVSFSSPLSSSSSFSSSPRSFSFSSSSPHPPPPPPPPFPCPFFFQMGPRRGGRSPCAPGRGGPLPRLPGRCLQEFTIRRWGSGPGLHGDGFPGSREVRRRPRTINGSMQAPLGSRPNSTGLRLVLSTRGKRGGARVRPRVRTRRGLCDAGLHAHLQSRQREGRVSGRPGQNESHRHSGTPADTARYAGHSHIGPRKAESGSDSGRVNALLTHLHHTPTPSGLSSHS